MSNRVTTLGSIARALGIAGIGAISVDVVCLRMARHTMQVSGELPSDLQALVIAGGIVVLAVYHVVSLIALVAQQKALGSARGARSISIAIGAISAILVAADPVMLQDIGNEFDAGFDPNGEWILLTVNFSVHAIYAVLSVAIISQSQKMLRRSASTPSVDKNDALFVTAHFIGAFTGWAGVIFLAVSGLASFWEPVLARQTVPLFSLIIATPFLLSVIVWSIERIRLRVLWDDEKQASDVRQASLVASIPAMILAASLYCAQLTLIEIETLAPYWFPLIAFAYIAVLSTRVAGKWRSSGL